MSWMDEWMDPIICPKLDKPKTASLFFNSCFPRMLYLMLWLSWCQYIEITFELCWNCVIVVAKREKKGGGGSFFTGNWLCHQSSVRSIKSQKQWYNSQIRPPSLPAAVSPFSLVWDSLLASAVDSAALGRSSTDIHHSDSTLTFYPTVSSPALFMSLSIYVSLCPFHHQSMLNTFALIFPWKEIK